VDDGFLVNLAQVTGFSRVLSGRQSEPPCLASALDSASTVDTGDPGLDSAIRDAIGHYRSVDADAKAAIQRAAGNRAQAAQLTDPLLGTSATDSPSSPPGTTPPDGPGGQPMSDTGNRRATPRDECRAHLSTQSKRIRSRRSAGRGGIRTRP
jgi:hypothetical protein